MLQGGAVCCSVFNVLVSFSVKHHIAVYLSVLEGGAVRCSVLQCSAVL